MFLTVVSLLVWKSKWFTRYMSSISSKNLSTWIDHVITEQLFRETGPLLHEGHRDLPQPSTTPVSTYSFIKNPNKTYSGHCSILSPVFFWLYFFTKFEQGLPFSSTLQENKAVLSEKRLLSAHSRPHLWGTSFISGKEYKPLCTPSENSVMMREVNTSPRFLLTLILFWFVVFVVVVVFSGCGNRVCVRCSWSVPTGRSSPSISYSLGVFRLCQRSQKWGHPATHQRPRPQSLSCTL